MIDASEAKRLIAEATQAAQEEHNRHKTVLKQLEDYVAKIRENSPPPEPIDPKEAKRRIAELRRLFAAESDDYRKRECDGANEISRVQKLCRHDVLRPPYIWRIITNFYSEDRTCRKYEFTDEYCDDCGGTVTSDRKELEYP